MNGLDLVVSGAGAGDPLPNPLVADPALSAESILSAGGLAPSGPDVQLPSPNSRMLIPAWHDPDRPTVVASATPFVRANGALIWEQNSAKQPQTGATKGKWWHSATSLTCAFGTVGTPENPRDAAHDLTGNSLCPEAARRASLRHFRPSHPVEGK